MTKTAADIRIKRIYDPPDAADGARVLVDRLWPRGVSKQKAALALWLKEIAPSDELRNWFDHDPARWPEFVHRYRAELKTNVEAVGQIADLLKSGPVTLLYSAHDAAHNQALALEGYLREHLRNSNVQHSA